jgi:hypothetical protein
MDKYKENIKSDVFAEKGKRILAAEIEPETYEIHEDDTDV